MLICYDNVNRCEFWLNDRFVTSTGYIEDGYDGMDAVEVALRNMAEILNIEYIYLMNQTPPEKE